ncbi:MAG: hypothetical protein IIB82_16055 [Bacteroidetes bacterium]|nr:hypothetical protein [Bacteroidota bacterium]
MVIDDECPDNSGLMARTIIENEYPEAYKTGRYKVLFLGSAIEEKDTDLPPGLTHKSGSNRSVKEVLCFLECDQQLTTSKMGCIS